METAGQTPTEVWWHSRATPAGNDRRPADLDAEIHRDKGQPLARARREVALAFLSRLPVPARINGRTQARAACLHREITQHVALLALCRLLHPCRHDHSWD